MEYIIFKKLIHHTRIMFGYFLLIIMAGVMILAILGLGWQTFFGGVQKGAEKVGITNAIKNLTSTIQNSLGNIVPNSSIGAQN